MRWSGKREEYGKGSQDVEREYGRGQRHVGFIRRTGCTILKYKANSVIIALFITSSHGSYLILRLPTDPTYESGIAAIASISIKKAPGNFPTSTAVRAGLGEGSMAL
jgi:hypothetical protein